MKKSKFSSTQIANILKEFDSGKTAESIQREHAPEPLPMILLSTEYLMPFTCVPSAGNKDEQCYCC